MKKIILLSIPLLVAACSDVAGSYEDEYGSEYADRASSLRESSSSSVTPQLSDSETSVSSSSAKSSSSTHSSSSTPVPYYSSSAYSSSSTPAPHYSSSAQTSSSVTPQSSSSSKVPEPAEGSSSSAKSSSSVSSSSSAPKSSSSSAAMCGGEVYNPSIKFCYEGTLHYLCNGETFNPNTHACSGSSLLPLCGTETYDTSTHFCDENEIHPLCGGESYTYAEAFCFEQSVHPKCNGETYDPTTNLCIAGVLKNLCGTQTYTPSDDIECKDGILYNMFTDSRDGKKYRYVTIGKYTVMADNLNYSDSVTTPNLKATSSCYNNETSYCNKYGRLYGWPAAVNLAHAYVADKYNITGTHRGICPEGWHVPTQSELLGLNDFVKSKNSKDPYNDLKSKTGWSTAGTNLYGFSAEPGGYYNMSFWRHYQINEIVGFWTTTEYASESAMYFSISNSGTSSDLTSKWDQYYLRCFAD